jgi:O-antigen/teichoic acid export membrane protein
MLVGRVLLKCISFVVVLLMTRYLGVKRYGLISYALALCGIFSIVFDLGITQFTIREIAAKRAIQSEVLSISLCIKIIIAAIVVTISLVEVGIFRLINNEGVVIWILISATSLRALGQVPYSAFAGNQMMEYVVSLEILQMLILIAGVGLTVLLNAGVIGIAVSYGVSYLAFVIVSFILLSRMSFIRIMPSCSQIWLVIKKCSPLAVMALSVEVYARIDTIMLKTLDSDISVGYYASAFRFMETGLLLSGAYISAAFPFLSSWVSRSSRKFRKYASSSLRLILCAGIGFAIFLYVLSPEILRLLFGKQFEPAAQTLRILAWATAVMFLGGLVSTLMVVIEKQIRNLVFITITIIADLAFDLVFIPRFHQEGAAYATFLAEGIYLIFCLVYLSWKKLLVWKWKRMVPFVLLSVCVGIICPNILQGLGVASGNRLVISILAYLVICYFLGVERAERTLAKHLLKRLRNRWRPA